jgi:hypothetical protein
MQNLQENQRESGKSAENNRVEQGREQGRELGCTPSLRHENQELEQSDDHCQCRMEHRGASLFKNAPKAPTPTPRADAHAKKPGAISARAFRQNLQIALSYTRRVTKSTRILHRVAAQLRLHPATYAFCCAITGSSRDPGGRPAPGYRKSSERVMVTRQPALSRVPVRFNVLVSFDVLVRFDRSETVGGPNCRSRPSQGGTAPQRCCHQALSQLLGSSSTAKYRVRSWRSARFGPRHAARPACEMETVRGIVGPLRSSLPSGGSDVAVYCGCSLGVLTRNYRRRLCRRHSWHRNAGWLDCYPGGRTSML